MSKTIVVSNLPLSVDSSDLEDMFTVVGDVLSALIERDPLSGASLGRGSVEMSTREEAENSVLHFNLQKVNGQMLNVHCKSPRGLKPKKTRVKFGTK